MTYKQNLGKAVVTQFPHGQFNYQIAREIGSTAALVLMRLGGECAWSSKPFALQRDRIAKDVVLSVSTVYREIKELRDRGLLEIIHGNAYAPNTYRLNMETITRLTTGGESAVSDESWDLNIVHAEFLHEPILLLEQVATIGHLSKEEVDAEFEYEKLCGVPHVNEPRLGKFYIKEDNAARPKFAKRSDGASVTEKKADDRQPLAENATPKMTKASKYSVSEQFWRTIAEFAYQESFDEQEQCQKYFAEKYLPEFTAYDFVHFFKQWKIKHPPPVKTTGDGIEPIPAETIAAIAYGVKEDRVKRVEKLIEQESAEAAESDDEE